MGGTRVWLTPHQIAVRAAQGLALGRLPPLSPLCRRPPGKQPTFARLPALVGDLPPSASRIDSPSARRSTCFHFPKGSFSAVHIVHFTSSSGSSSYCEPKSLDHEMRKFRCIQTNAAGSEQSTNCSTAGVRQ